MKKMTIEEAEASDAYADMMRDEMKELEAIAKGHLDIPMYERND